MGSTCPACTVVVVIGALAIAVANPGSPTVPTLQPEQVRIVKSELPIAPAPRVWRADFRITSPDGETYISQDDIVVYDWVSHTMILKPGFVKALRKKLRDGLGSGVPFVVRANGAECYRGKIFYSISCTSHQGPKINADGYQRDDDDQDDQLRIKLGSRYYLNENDPQSDKRVFNAMKALDKLELATPIGLPRIALSPRIRVGVVSFRTSLRLRPEGK